MSMEMTPRESLKKLNEFVALCQTLLGNSEEDFVVYDGMKSAAIEVFEFHTEDKNGKWTPKVIRTTIAGGMSGVEIKVLPRVVCERG